MRKSSFACHAAVLLAAFHWSQSSGEFLVAGLGFALLLDRYLLHLLPWPTPLAWKREVCVRAGCGAIGAVGFYCLRLGVVSVLEAVSLGVAVSLLVFLLETLVAGLFRFTLLCRRVPASPRRARLEQVGLGLLVVGWVVVLVGPLVALHPLHTVPKRTPAALGLAFDDIRLPAQDGLELAAWVVPHPQARGNVIFCHGWGRNRGHVVGFLPTLHQLGLNVLAFDFRGHGDSPGHTLTFGHREVLDVLAAAEYLRRRFPGQPLFLVGVSYGAAVSLQALPELPSVRGVWSEGCFSRLGDVIDHYFDCFPAGLRHLLLPSWDTLAWLDCGFWGPDINPIERLAGERVPICFCHGRKDDLIPFAEGEALYQAYPGPKCHYWVEDASHYNLRQRDRAEYLKRLRTFFEERLSVPTLPHSETLPRCGP